MKEILRKPRTSDDFGLHFFPSEPANQHSHGTGRAAFTRSEITHITHGLRVHSLGAHLKFCTFNSLLIGEEAESQGLSPKAKVLLSLIQSRLTAECCETHWMSLLQVPD